MPPGRLKRTPDRCVTDGITRRRILSASVFPRLPLAKITEPNEIVPQAGEMSPLRTIGICEFGFNQGLDRFETGLEA